MKKYQQIFDDGGILELSSDYTQISFIELVEKKYKASFVCDTELTSTDCSVVFPLFLNERGYFSIFKLPHPHGGYKIFSPKEDVEKIQFGSVRSINEIIYSRTRHDYRVCKNDSSIWVDGGRTYTRSSTKVTGYHIENGVFIKNEIQS